MTGAPSEYDDFGPTFRTGFLLDPRTGELTRFSERRSAAGQCPEEAYGHLIAFPFARPLSGTDQDVAVTASLEDLGALVVSYDETWDGHNFVAGQSDLAESPAGRIQVRLADLDAESDVYGASTMGDIFDVIEDQPLPHGVNIDHEGDSDRCRLTDARTGVYLDVWFSHAGSVSEDFADALAELEAAVDAQDD